jgi:hypothetical protein
MHNESRYPVVLIVFFGNFHDLVKQERTGTLSFRPYSGVNALSTY